MKRPREQGAALVIVLAFMVMLVGVVVAFFVKASNDRQVADSSASQTSAELFARGAMDTIIGDLRQEIADGSTATTNVTGSITNIIYLPWVVNGGTNVWSNAVPALVGSSGTNGLQNLVKISTNAPFYSRLGPSGTVLGTNRVSSISTTNASLNYRSISAARWNRPLFITPTSTNDYTPLLTAPATFPTPSWIYVDRAGGNPKTWSTSLRFSPTNPSSVIGRYAYAIYDEGGLLDINAAGFPSAMTNASATWPRTNSLYAKISLAYADLSQLTTSGGTPLLTASQIDQLINWRNTASLTNTSSVVNTAISYGNYARSFPDFLSAGNTSLLISGGMTNSDHPFATRQQLVNYVTRQLGGSTNTNTLQALQYFSTFTRSLNQPSLYWPTNIPTIVSGIGSSNAAFTDYAGGNCDFGFDFQINTNFLAVRVTNSFTRNDGSQAIVGEPLVKRCFPLEYLTWITAWGPISDGLAGTATGVAGISADSTKQGIAGRYYTNNGISWSTLQKGTSNNIRNYFGLVWNSADRVWDYTPRGASTGYIKYLNDLSGTGEPNFVELLKASIKAGSLGKSTGGFSASSDTNTYGQLHQLAATTDNHIMQLAANIIEQAKLDAYPVRIRFKPDSTYTLVFAGSENLPYIYRWRVVAAPISQPVIKRAAGGFTPITAPLTNASGPLFTNAVGDTLYPGYGVLQVIPEIWNCYDQNSSGGLILPPRIRLVADNIVDPKNFSIDGSTNLGGSANVVVYQATGTVNGSSSTATGAGAPAALFRLSPASSALLIDPYNGVFFREPTLLRNASLFNCSYQTFSGLMSGNFPPDSNNATTTLFTTNGIRDYRDPSSNNVFGIPMGYYQLTRTLTNGTTNYVFNGNATNIPWGRPRHNQNLLTLRMQYLDTDNATWRDYDTKKWVNTSWNGAYATYLISGNNDPFTNNINWQDLIGRGGHYFVFDPRTTRFQVSSASSGGATNGGGAEQGENPGYRMPQGVSITNGYITSASLFYNNATIGTMVTNFYRSNNILGPSHFSLYGYQYNSVDTSPGGVNGLNVTSGSGFRCIINGSVSALSPSTLYDAGMCCNITNCFFVYPTNSGTTIWTNTAYYSDPDGVVRRAMGAYPQTNAAGLITNTLGIPTIVTTASWNTATPTPIAQSQSRPVILHRPFRSVAELGYVFRDVPWKNLDFFTPESGDAGLLDTFSVHDFGDQNALTAGKVNLNTRQTPVIRALLSGSQTDELLKSGTTGYTFTNTAIQISATEMTNIATNLIARTATSPLTHLGDLVGQWRGSGYSGFSADLTNCYTNPTNICIQRFHESAIRSLANSGQTRVWNLMIDLVAQTGRFPASAGSLSNFLVEGERRVWIHVAIDRFTGAVLDCQIEPVNE